MRYISKGTSPAFFEDWKQQFRMNESVEPAYKDLRGEDYHRLKTHLIDEQYGLCCYCCAEIEDYNSHIEHFFPRSMDTTSQFVLDYRNLLVSCDGYKGNHENCGHKKDNWYSSYYTVSPLDTNCESMFTYTVDGHIRPNHEDTRAQETISHLELNLDILQRARRSALFVSGFFDADFDDDKREDLIQFYSTPQNSKLNGFCVSILYCLANY